MNRYRSQYLEARLTRPNRFDDGAVCNGVRTASVRKNASFSWLLLFVLFFSVLGKAAEQPGVKEFNIRSQRADKGLKTFGRQADVTVLYRFGVIRRHQTNKLVGEYSIAQAIDILLKNTQLTGRFDQSGNLLIKEKKQSQSEDKNMIPGTKRTLVAAAVAASLSPALHAQEQQANGQQANEQEAQTEVIEIRGIRSSLAKAQQIKRDASAVIDVITVEDLGKFSDNSVADSLSRVPGVQINRNDDGRSGSRAAIRGMGAAFATTTINGRSVFSGGAEGNRELRSFSFDTLPSEIFNEIVVNKTPTADLTDTGLAGGINIKTLRPLDAAPLKDENIFGSVTAGYEDHTLAGKGQRYSALVGGKNEESTLGWYAALLNSDTNTGTLANEWEQPNNIERLTIGSTLYQNVRAPGQSSIEDLYQNQTREAFVGAIEWLPSENFSLVIDYNVSNYESENLRSRTSVRNQDALLAGAVFREGTAEVVGGQNGGNLVFADFTGLQTVEANSATGCSSTNLTACAPRAFHVPLLFDVTSDSQIGGVKFDWQASDRLNVQGDIYFSELEYVRDFFAYETSTPNPNFSFDSRGGGNTIYRVDPSAIDRRDARFDIYVAADNQLEVDSVGAALDFDYDLDWGPVETLEFGVRYTDTTYDRIDTLALIFPDSFTADDQSRFLDVIYSGERFDGGSGFDLIRANEDLLRSVSAELLPGATNVIDGISGRGDSLNIRSNRDVQNSTSVDETQLAVYIQANGAFDFGSIPTTFNAGVRFLDVDYDASGSGLVNGNPGVLSSEPSVEVLPSFNMNLALSDDLALRIGLGRSVSQPEIEELFTPLRGFARVCDANQTACQNEFVSYQGGNPELDPTSAWTLDSTLEWYTGEEGGSVIVSAFYKAISDFIRTSSTQTTLPAPPGDSVAAEGTPVRALLRGPVNISDADVYGFEVGFNQPLSIFSEALDGFGIQANYTFVDSEFDNDEDPLLQLGFPGASQDNISAVAYYEKNKLGVRIAYTYRSDFVASLNAPTVTTPLAEPRQAEGWEQLNASISYELTEDISVRFTATDIFESERREFVDDRERFRAFYQRGRTIAAAVTARF